MDKDIKVTLKVWRQKGPKDKGQFETYQIDKINQSVSFLEMLDILNERLVSEGKEPIVFDHDCREGICGMCSLYVNGHPHGPATGATTCQLYMRRFNDGETITIEPWRSAGFPVIRDLMVDRYAYDKIIQAAVLVLLLVRTVQLCCSSLQRLASWLFCLRVRWKLLVVQKQWLLRWMNWALVTVRTLALAKWNVRRTSPLATSLA